MIISVSEFKNLVNITETDAILELRLQSIEALIRQYTNNNFQLRNIRSVCSIENGKLLNVHPLIGLNDTIEITQSQFNNGIYTYNDSLILNDESNVLVTKVVYPLDIKVGVIRMLKWNIENQDKVGVASESISRHSVTYFNMDGDNSLMGYPKSLTGFLKPYVKARF